MHATMKGYKTMFFTKKASAEINETDLTDEQLTEVTGGAGGLLTSLLGSPAASSTTSTGTTIQAGVQAAAGVGVQTDALNSVTGLL